MPVRESLYAIQSRTSWDAVRASRGSAGRSRRSTRALTFFRFKVVPPRRRSGRTLSFCAHFTPRRDQRSHAVQTRTAPIRACHGCPRSSAASPCGDDVSCFSLHAHSICRPCWFVALWLYRTVLPARMLCLFTLLCYRLPPTLLRWLAWRVTCLGPPDRRSRHARRPTYLPSSSRNGLLHRYSLSIVCAPGLATTSL